MHLFRRKGKVEPPVARVAPHGDTFLEEVKWMTQADAEKFAKERGYEYEEM